MSESRTRRSVRNVIWTLATQVVLIALGFAVRTALVVALGLEYVGMNAALMGIITMMTLAEAGMGASVMYAMYAPLRSHDPERIVALVGFARTMFRWVTGVLGAVGLVVAFFIDDLVGSVAEDSNATLYFVVLLVGLCSKYLMMHRSLVVIADQRLYLTKLYNFIVQTLRSGLQIYVLLVWESFLAFVTIYALGQLVYAFVVHKQSARLYPFLRMRPTPVPEGERNQLYANLRAMFWYRAGVRILSNATPVIAVVVAGLGVAGQYANYLLVVSSMLVILDLTFQALTASFGNLVVASDRAAVNRVFKELNVAAFFLYGVTAGAFLAVLQDVISVWLGADAQLSSVAAVLVVVNYMAYGQMAPVGVVREATGAFRQVRFVLPATAAAATIMSIVLGLWLGITGVLLGPVVARVLVSNWMEPYLLIRLAVGGSFVRYIARVASWYLAVGVAAVVVRHILPVGSPASVSSVVVDAAIALLVSTLVLLAVFGWLPESRGLVGRAYSSLRR